MGILCQTGGSHQFSSPEYFRLFKKWLTKSGRGGGVPDTPGTPSPPARPLISEALGRSKTP